MKIRAIRGRDQKGLSFLSPLSGALLLGKPLMVSYQDRCLLSDVRASKSVPERTMVLDTRLFDDLQLEDEVEVEVEQVTEGIPICEEAELVYWALNSTVPAIPIRTEDLGPHIGGRILKTGQELTLAEQGIRLRIERLHPVAASTQAARVGWKRPPRIELHPGEEHRAASVRNRDAAPASLPRTKLPEIILEKRAETAENLRQRLAVVSRELDEIGALDLQRRVESLENRISSLAGIEGRAASDSAAEGSQDLPSVSGTPLKNLYARLKEVVDRLESLSSRLENLERRIETLAEKKNR